MAKKTAGVLAIPQTDSAWYCAMRRLRTFIENDSGGYFRPWFVIVVAIETSVILFTELTENAMSPAELNQKLVKTMRKPLDGAMSKPHRPREIHFEEEGLAEALQPLLAQANVTARYQPQREALDALIKSMEESLFGENEIPGLLSQPGITPEQVGSFFSAASAFYQAEPWIELSNDDILSVKIAPQKNHTFWS